MSAFGKTQLQMALESAEVTLLYFTAPMPLIFCNSASMSGGAFPSL
jgi:hypothetical protein